MLRRRDVLLWSGLAAAGVARGQGPDTVRGRLAGELKLKLAGGRVVRLSGDVDSVAVLNDARLAHDEFELRGRLVAPDGFAIDAIHTRAIFIWRGGRKLTVTYWCPVCSIRAWTPGLCQCCQEEMALDPRDPALKDTDP